MNKILETILRYLGQSSTYKGLFSVLAAFGVVLKPEMADAIIACALGIIALGIIGLINVIIDDHKHTDNKGAEA